ncbi:hypothetical protein E3P92_02678 [Wallemia ichthyophaga]|nr:hypothetical protein E3P91_02951 [Wallemia ichthyophaga]TIA97834.1 hypothetical protein E3P94_03178 [Wallemia ichthyophaga]TIB10496.1 hypothetical protein E3P93_02878 [Wallemia ichthyophaga]TIB12142.1 hypothetical protein E3P92_02678 [Wallemia ichthyophaga]TIB21061.1 hypothetical protein E3P89_02854 [Wallemia ichthyophaga]
MVIAISVRNLSFSFNQADETALKNLSMDIEQGSRCLLVGANGAGKSTLLRILAGKRLTKGHVQVYGKDVFQNQPSGITYLGTEWAMNPVVRGDIRVSEFLDSVGGFRHKDRRDTLLNILDVDVDWRMHQISDGERRRVQLVMGLMVPWTLLLLDEVTVDLDVVVRTDLINFLIAESKERNATILYATHICMLNRTLTTSLTHPHTVDGLFNFPTHVMHMRLGSNVGNPEPWPLVPQSPLHHTIKQSNVEASPLLKLALAWLREDLVYRREYEKSIDRQRGARSETTDSETFYSRFDYWKGK